MGRLARLAGLGAIGLVALWLGACASSQPDLDVRRAAAEQEIVDRGLAGDPEIDVRRAELDAAIAGEGDAPVIDGLELRTSVSYERSDERVVTLARVPIEDLLSAPARREAKRAESEVALARLQEATLQQRVTLCFPSLDQLVYREALGIYEEYAARQRRLLAWNRDMEQAGQVNEVGALVFEIESEVKLATRAPNVPLLDPRIAAANTVLAVLPDPRSEAARLSASEEVVGGLLRLHRPEVEALRAQQRRFAALARAEETGRYPTLRFFDLGYEALPYGKDPHEVATRVALEIPFGAGARARQERFESLLRGERSAERALVASGVQDTQVALAVINRFREQGDSWLGLLERANAAEQVADQWWEQRLADPGQIARLLDEVHAARTAVLDARERAGAALCAVLSATGVAIEEWPRG